jgi:hypothetical protein
VNLEELTFDEYYEYRRQALPVMTVPLPEGFPCRCGATITEAKFSPRSGQWLAVCGKCGSSFRDAGTGPVDIYVDDPKLKSKLMCGAGFVVPPCPFTLPKRSKTALIVHPDDRRSFVVPLLRRKGWSTNHWATISDVDFNTAKGYLAGKKTYRASLIKLARSLGIDPDSFPK